MSSRKVRASFLHLTKCFSQNTTIYAFQFLVIPSRSIKVPYMYLLYCIKIMLIYFQLTGMYSTQYFLLLFFINLITYLSIIYLFILLDREREWGQAEREGENPEQALHCQHGARHGVQSYQPWDYAQSRNQEPNAQLTESPRPSHLITYLKDLFKRAHTYLHCSF